MDYEKKIDGNLCQPLGSNFMIMIKIRPLVYNNIVLEFQVQKYKIR